MMSHHHADEVYTCHAPPWFYFEGQGFGAPLTAQPSFRHCLQIFAAERKVCARKIMQCRPLCVGVIAYVPQQLLLVVLHYCIQRHFSCICQTEGSRRSTPASLSSRKLFGEGRLITPVVMMSVQSTLGSNPCCLHSKARRLMLTRVWMYCFSLVVVHGLPPQPQLGEWPFR